jgi:PIN domain nuclease of toxin-antitoxin system
VSFAAGFGFSRGAKSHKESWALQAAEICSVNGCKILTRMQREKLEFSAERLSAVLAGVEVVSIEKAEAEVAAAYSRVNRALSLGDRACMALARCKQATAWTTERLWSQCQIDVPVELIRN